MTGSVRTCCGCRTQVPDGDIRLLVGPPPVTRTGPVSWTIYFGRDSRVVASCPALVQEGA